MARLEIGKHLAVDSRVCGGRLIFRRTRILVSDALELLDAGYSAEEVAGQYRGAVRVGAVDEARTLTRRGVVREVTSRPAARSFSATTSRRIK